MTNLLFPIVVLPLVGFLINGLLGNRLGKHFVSVVACGEGPSCFHGLARTFDLPEFMFVDMKAKVVRATSESPFKKVDSPIKNAETTRNHFILQGVENGHGWNMSIDRSSGRMTTTLSGELVSYMIFGACTAQ